MPGPWDKFSKPLASSSKPWERFQPNSAQSLAQSEPVAPENEPVEDFLPREKFEEIGQKYGVSGEELRSLAPYYGARPEPETGSVGEAASYAGKRAAGFLGQTVGLGIPQFAYKKLQEPNMRKALDEVRDLALKQQTPLETAREFVTPIAQIPAVSAAGRIISAAGTGAAIGASGSKEGKELEGAAVGGAIGGGLGAAGEVVGKLLRKAGATPIEEQMARKQSVDLDQGIKDIQGKTEKSEKILEEIGFGDRTALKRADVDSLVHEQISKDKLDDLLNPATEEGQVIRATITKNRPDEIGKLGIEETARRQLADDIIHKRIIDFADDIGEKRPKDIEEAISTIKEFSSRQGGEATLNRYNQFKEVAQAERYLAETGDRAAQKANALSRGADFVSDAQYVLRHIDERNGSKTEDILRSLNKDYNRSTFALKDFRQRQADLFKAASKSGTDKSVSESTKIYDALDKGAVQGLSPEELATAQNFKKYFDDTLEFANGLVKSKDPRIAPLAIPKRENYVPHMMKPVEETVPLMEKKLTQALDQISSDLGRPIQDLAQLQPSEFTKAMKNQDIQDLTAALKLFDNKPVKNGQELSGRLKDMIGSREGQIAMETKARSALERSGEIPDFLLEKNLYKLADKYAANTLRHLYLRNSVDALRYEASKLNKAGASVDAKYVENLVKDILGVRKGTAAELFMQTKVQGMRKLDQMIDKVGKDSVRGGILTAAKAIPDTMYDLSRQIYPNMLGYLNVRAALQNLTSGFTKLAPELGTKYGYITTMRGAVYAVANMKKLIERARQMGNIPAEFTRKGEMAIQEGIRRSSLYRLSDSALEGMGKAGMVLFQLTENFNRALSTGVAEMMAHDLARGSRMAMDSLQSKFPVRIKKLVMANLHDPEETSKVLAQYLNDTTQYNYNRMSMSEFGRTVGPMFSVFSKWPTATIGDILTELRTKGVLKGSARAAEKYVVPLLLLQSMDYLMGERMGDKDSLSDIQKKLVGQGGLSQSAPIGSASGFLTGEIFTPPMVDALMQSVIEPALKQDTTKVSRGLGNALGQFAPGAGLFRFITDDLVTYATGHRPEGSDFIERTVEGARELKK